MIKQINCLTRKPSMPVEEFRRYWLEVHGPLVAKMPGVRRYEQCHTLDSAYADDRQPAYDGTAELWFDDFQALRAAYASPEGKVARADAPAFLDLSRCIHFEVEEHPMVGSS